MKTIFDKTTRDELIGRISRLDENSTAQWAPSSAIQLLIPSGNECTGAYLNHSKKSPISHIYQLLSEINYFCVFPSFRDGIVFKRVGVIKMTISRFNIEAGSTLQQISLKEIRDDDYFFGKGCRC